MNIKHSSQLEILFQKTFFERYKTLLIGGANEPLYQPIGGGGEAHCLYYRADYFSSALHETAHWCVAGHARRQQVDFGYWYNPDGRTAEQQRLFEQVEVKPQALEWIFSTACGIRFEASVDNLSAQNPEDSAPSADFLQSMQRQVIAYCHGQINERAAGFVRALQQFYGVENALDKCHYS